MTLPEIKPIYWIIIVLGIIAIVYIFTSKARNVKDMYVDQVKSITGENAYSTSNSDVKIQGGKGEFPRIVFQTWKSTTEIPDNMRYWHDTWKIYNPNYEHLLWDDGMNRQMIEDKFPWFLDVFDGYSHNINRADAIRYFFLYTHGGIYADMDFECLREFDTLLDQYKQYDIIFGRMRTREGDNNGNANNIPNAIMVSKSREIFWLYVIRQLMLNKDRIGVEEQTGPVMLKEALENYISQTSTKTGQEWLNDMINKMPDNLKPNKMYSDIVILDPEVLYPLSWNDLSMVDDTQRNKVLGGMALSETTEIMKQIYPNAYAITYWTHTW